MDDLEPETPPLTFAVATDDGTVTVTIAGELDISGVDRVAAAAEPALRAGPQHIVVDASELRFADSSAIALWVRWSRRESTFELRNPAPLLERVITRMGLSDSLLGQP